MSGYKSKRQKDIEQTEKNNKHPFCNHSKDNWCQDCINFGEEIDLTHKGLGKGHFYTNIPNLKEELLDNIEKYTKL